MVELLEGIPQTTEPTTVRPMGSRKDPAGVVRTNSLPRIRAKPVIVPAIE
jgi:hypothetical protein